MKKFTSFIKKAALPAAMVILIFLIVANITNAFVIDISRHSGKSMFPTIDNNYTIGIWYMNMKIDKYDIISFKGTDSVGEDAILAKRVIGLPGDTIKCVYGKVYVNGELDELFPYSDPDNPYAMFKYNNCNFEYILDENEYFVMGDNRTNSYDSRDFGPIKYENIVDKELLY